MIVRRGKRGHRYAVTHERQRRRGGQGIWGGDTNARNHAAAAKIDGVGRAGIQSARVAELDDSIVEIDATRERVVAAENQGAGSAFGNGRARAC